MSRFKGVATKKLSNYLGWHRYLDSAKGTNVCALPFLLEQQKQLQPGRVDIADLQQVELNSLACREGVEHMGLLFKGMIDGQILARESSWLVGMVVAAKTVRFWILWVLMVRSICLHA